VIVDLRLNALSPNTYGFKHLSLRASLRGGFILNRYILTGTPGSGKTALIRAFEMRGEFVVEEAATDLISYEHARGHEEPWKNPRFIDDIIKLQRQRQKQVEGTALALQFYDRSPICTFALALHLGYTPSALLMEEIKRIEREKIYQKQVFFIDNLGFITTTEARRISYEAALEFEKLHLETYASFGYECMRVQPKPIESRVDAILGVIRGNQGG
jgi:predicted ATPase